MSWEITEVATLITDYVLCAEAALFAWLLKRPPASETRKAWSGLFTAVAAAALLGGTQHGFQIPLGPQLVRVLGSAVLLALNAAAYALLRGTAFSCLRPGAARDRLLQFGLLKSAVFAVWAVAAPTFLVGMIDYGSALLCSAIAWSFAPFSRKARAALSLGFLVTLAASLIQALHVSPHPSFNHNDLYHVVQMLGLWLLYKGAVELKDRAAPTSRT
jgi:hypothetical protein